MTAARPAVRGAGGHLVREIHRRARAEVVLTDDGLALLKMRPIHRRGIAVLFAEHLGGDPGNLSATLRQMAESARGRGV